MQKKKAQEIETEADILVVGEHKDGKIEEKLKCYTRVMRRRSESLDQSSQDVGVHELKKDSIQGAASPTEGDTVKVIPPTKLSYKRKRGADTRGQKEKQVTRAQMETNTTCMRGALVKFPTDRKTVEEMRGEALKCKHSISSKYEEIPVDASPEAQLFKLQYLKFFKIQHSALNKKLF